MCGVCGRMCVLCEVEYVRECVFVVECCVCCVRLFACWCSVSWCGVVGVVMCCGEYVACGCCLVCVC